MSVFFDKRNNVSAFKSLIFLLLNPPQMSILQVQMYLIICALITRFVCKHLQMMCCTVSGLRSLLVPTEVIIMNPSDPEAQRVSRRTEQFPSVHSQRT